MIIVDSSALCAVFFNDYDKGAAAIRLELFLNTGELIDRIPAPVPVIPIRLDEIQALALISNVVDAPTAVITPDKCIERRAVFGKLTSTYINYDWWFLDYWPRLVPLEISPSSD